ncbi:MAG: flagellar export chaperone FlgN [Mariprofundus sp.]
MVIKSLSKQTLSALRALLEKMDACARELELVSSQEYDAIRALDSEQIMALTDRRILIHQCLARLEQDGRTLLTRANVPADMSMEVLIDLFADDQTGAFQALRRNLYERLLQVDRQSQENSMRLRAAYNVSTSILQNLGLIQKEQTYGRNISR